MIVCADLYLLCACVKYRGFLLIFLCLMLTRGIDVFFLHCCSLHGIEQSVSFEFPLKLLTSDLQLHELLPPM